MRVPTRRRRTSGRPRGHAQQPILVAAYHAARQGRPCVPADPGLGLAANFLLQLRGTPPSARDAEIMDSCLVLHADHKINASTFTARVFAATMSDMHSAWPPRSAR